MDIRADIQGVRTIAQIEAALPITRVGDVREEAAGRLANIALGQQIQATVTALLEDGSFLVKLADTAIRTSLPSGSKVGDALQLTLVATEPRPTFSLEGEARAAPTRLSPTARLIDTLLRHGDATTLLGKTPLVGTPAAAPEQLAASLQKTLSSSGLFYEAHLQQWASGTRPMADLLREPQNLQRPAALPTPLGDAAIDVLALTSKSSADGVHLSSVLADASAAQVDTPLHPETARIVNLQLNAIEQPRIQWQGEVWPGQRMDWEVSEERPRADTNNSEEAQRSWQSVVRFELPTLGKVAAVVTLVGDHVQVQVRAANGASAETLRKHGGRLADALGAAGSTLDSLTVKHDEEI